MKHISAISHGVERFLKIDKNNSSMGLCASQVSETVAGNVVRAIIDMLLKTFQYPRKKAELPLGVLAGSYSLFDMQLCKQSPEHADEPRPLERPSRKTSTSSTAQKEYFAAENVLLMLLMLLFPKSHLTVRLFAR